jgi:hypothetical protein
MTRNSLASIGMAAIADVAATSPAVIAAANSTELVQATLETDTGSACGPTRSQTSSLSMKRVGVYFASSASPAKIAALSSSSKSTVRPDMTRCSKPFFMDPMSFAIIVTAYSRSVSEVLWM